MKTQCGSSSLAPALAAYMATISQQQLPARRPHRPTRASAGAWTITIERTCSAGVGGVDLALTVGEHGADRRGDEDMHVWTCSKRHVHIIQMPARVGVLLSTARGVSSGNHRGAPEPTGRRPRAWWGGAPGSAGDPRSVVLIRRSWRSEPSRSDGRTTPTCRSAAHRRTGPHASRGRQLWQAKRHRVFRGPDSRCHERCS